MPTVAPPVTPPTRLAIGVCGVVLAYANPVLMSEIGSSFADVLTAEIGPGTAIMNAARRSVHRARFIASRPTHGHETTNQPITPYE